MQSELADIARSINFNPKIVAIGGRTYCRVAHGPRPLKFHYVPVCGFLSKPVPPPDMWAAWDSALWNSEPEGSRGILEPEGSRG